MRQENTIRVTLLRMLCSLVVLVGIKGAAAGQEIQLGVDFQTAVPLSEFGDNLGNNSYGVGGQFAVRLGRSPILLGVDAGISRYGSERRNVSLSPTIPEIALKVRTNNNILMTHFMVRAQPRRGAARPYADGLVGLKYLFTNTSVSDDFADEPIASTTNFSDTAFSYGVGGGVQIQLGQSGTLRRIMLDPKVRYLRGSRADYLVEGSILRMNGSIFFDSLRSRTDMFTVQIGVTFRL